MYAARTADNQISLRYRDYLAAAPTRQLELPCGKCLACQQRSATHWALRCHMESQLHTKSCFLTLTYANENLPLTLTWRHVQLALKRLRQHTITTPLPHRTTGAAQRISLRYFACGEYGEQNHRPHYHLILWGINATDRSAIETSWGLGHIHLGNVTPESIGYVAGYAVKYNRLGAKPHERVDPTTGEVYTWHPPFVQMSRRPGIGGHARQYAASWKEYAIKDGHKISVPRFYKEAWKKTATPEELQQQRAKTLQHIATLQKLDLYQQEAIAEHNRNRDKQTRQL